MTFPELTSKDNPILKTIRRALEGSPKSSELLAAVEGIRVLEEATLAPLNLKDGKKTSFKIKFVFSGLPEIVSVLGKAQGFEKTGDGINALSIKLGRFDEANVNIVHRLKSIQSHTNREAFKAPAFLL